MYIIFTFLIDKVAEECVVSAGEEHTFLKGHFLEKERKTNKEILMQWLNKSLLVLAMKNGVSYCGSQHH